MQQCRFRPTLEALEDRCLLSGGDWFDNNLRDATLRSLVRTLDAHHQFGRKEVLAVFTQVEKDRTITANEFADLQTIVANGSYLGIPDAVQDLANKVVNGDNANRSYQGTNLGNLNAWSSGAQLEKLVNKWFLGADHPLAQDGNQTYGYKKATGSLFGNGPSYQDVRQGGTGDCYYLATLAETAVQTPATIQHMFTDNGDRTWTVRFYHNGTPSYVTVDAWVPATGDGHFVYANMGQSVNDWGSKLWVPLAEKALAQWNESGWAGHAAVNSYAAIFGGTAALAIQLVTGQNVSHQEMRSFDDISTAFRAGNVVALASNDNRVDSQVVPWHFYAVVGYDAQARTMTLFNPWGMKNTSNKPGQITLTWNQIVSNFKGWDTFMAGGARASGR
jgi:hypothetical protein